MADELYTGGKVDAMSVGIINGIGAMKLYTAAGASTVNSATGLTSSDFTVDANGQLTNVNDIEVTIAVGDIDKVITYVVLQNSAQTVNKMKIDLSPSITLTTAGTATLAAGALSVDFASTI